MNFRFHRSRRLSVGRTVRGCQAAILTGIAVALTALAAEAQWGGGRGGWGMNWSSTAQEGADRGLAAVVQAQGYANLQNSEAAKNWEQAKTLEMQNRLRWSETYFEMRQVNRDKRADEAGPRVTQEQAIRLAKMAAQPRLGSTQR